MIDADRLRDLLPPCALAVIDGGEGSVEYYDFLTLQTLGEEDQR